MFSRRQQPSRAEFPQVDLAAMAGPEDRRKALVELRAYVESLAAEQSAWYKNNRVTRQIVSLWIRFFSLFFLFVGGLCPLLPKDTPSSLIGSLIRNVEPWGYTLIGLGGGLLLFDRLFGISSSWMRFIWAYFEIGELVDEFRMRWIKTQLEAADAQSADTFQALVAIAEDAIKGIHAIVRLETAAWRVEFQNNIAHQIGLGKSQPETQVPADNPGKRSSLGLVRKS